MDENNRRLIALIVISGVIASVIAGGFLVVTREFGITDDKARYFYEEYSSDYDVYVNGSETPGSLRFSSISTSSANLWEAEVILNSVVNRTNVNKEGILLDGGDDSYLFMWWEEEDLTLEANQNGNGLAIISDPKSRKVKDPFGLFLTAGVNYTAVCESSLVYLKGRFATQASYEYTYRRESDGRIVGHSIIDMTSGLPFEINFYEEGKDSVRLELKSTTFIISRNRHRLLGAATIILPIAFVVLFLILKKKKGLELNDPEMQECLLLGGIGMLAFYIDQFFDFWWTYTTLMPVVYILHFVPIALILIFRRDLWRFLFLPLLELGLFAVFTFFNMGIFVLWLSYGNVMLWFALMAHVHEGKRDK